MSDTDKPPGKLIPMPAAPKPPKMPPWIRGEGRRFWKQHEAELVKRGLLDGFMSLYFALVCSQWRAWREISDQITRDGLTIPGRSGRPVAHPLLAAQNRELKMFRLLSRDMGMSPTRRGK